MNYTRLLTYFACERETESSVGTWGDSEDITERCYLDMFVKSIGGSVTEEGETKPKASFRFIKKSEGGVIGMHRVVHKDLEFKAKTSKGLSKSVIYFSGVNFVVVLFSRFRSLGKYFCFTK